MLIFLTLLIVLLYFVVKKQGVPSISNPFVKEEKLTNIEDRYNSKKVKEENELNALLEKINKIGYDKLSKTEKNRLEELSKK